MDKKAGFYVWVVIVLLFIVGLCWYLLREPGVRDQRDRAYNVTESLGRAGVEQQNASNAIERVGRAIDDSIERADGITERISKAENAITTSADRQRECDQILRDSESRIAESRAIIQRIRERTREN